MKVIQETIGDLLGEVERVPIVTPNDPVSRAIQLFRDARCAAVLVCDATGVVGIFTERDLLYKVAALELNADEIPLSDVMTANPRVLRATDCVTYAINRMAVFGFSNIPIVDGAGRPVALLGVRDVLSHLHQVFDALEDEDNDTAQFEVADWVDHGGG